MSHAATLPRARRRRRKPPRLLIALAIVLVEVLMLAWSVEHAVTGSDRVWALILIGVYVYLLSQDWPKLVCEWRKWRDDDG